MTKKQDVKEIITLNIDELYLELGRELEGKGILPKNKEELIKLASIWYKNNIEKITEVVCKNKGIKSILSSSQGENDFILVTAIADLISVLVIGVSPITVAALLVKKGISTICSEENKCQS